MKHLQKKEPAASTAGQASQEASQPILGSNKRQASESGILNAIGCVTFEQLANGRFLVRYPEPGGTEFPSDQEKEARELFQSVARAEKGYPSGFDPCARTNGPESPLRGRGRESFNARAVRKLCKDDIPLPDFLDRCLAEIRKLLEWIDQAEGDETEKYQVKQRLLRFQAQKRLGKEEL